MEDEEIIPEEDEGLPERPESFVPIDEQLAEHRARVKAAKEKRDGEKKSPPEEPKSP